MNKRTIYLDYAAATPLDAGVLKLMEPYFSKQFYNPSATYLSARSVRHDIDQARAEIANILGSRPAEIIFTSGATEANNLALYGVSTIWPEGQILVSAIEHESVMAPAKSLGAHFIPVDSKGIVDVGWLAKNISEKTALISVMLVNNELGSLQPLREISEIIASERKSRRVKGNQLPIYLHTDAAQAANFLDLHVSRLGVDLMSVNGGKLYGPKQAGFLYMRSGVLIAPQILGGGQEFGQRSGTENVPGIIGLAEALGISQKMKSQALAKTRILLQRLGSGLLQIYPKVMINGSAKHRAPHILSATFPGFDNERLMFELDERGIIVAVGSACSASREKASHVLGAIGLSPDSARSTLRFSLGRTTTEADIDETLKTLRGLLNPQQ